MKELWEQVPRLLWEQTHKTPPETGTVDWSNALSCFASILRTAFSVRPRTTG